MIHVGVGGGGGEGGHSYVACVEHFLLLRFPDNTNTEVLVLRGLRLRVTSAGCLLLPNLSALLHKLEIKT